MSHGPVDCFALGTPLHSAHGGDRVDIVRSSGTMNRETEQFDVRRIGPGCPDHLAALHLALGVRLLRTGAPAPAVSELVASAARRSCPLTLVFGAYRHGKLITAAVAAEYPGSAALVFHPTDPPGLGGQTAVVEALRQLQVAASRRPIRLLEALVPPAAPQAGAALGEAGFRYLTRLQYLSRPGAYRDRDEHSASDLDWVGYADEAAPLFRRALELSYVESLDCPELAGLRQTDEVLAGHRATGVFEPALWWVACRGGAPVGIGLLNRIGADAGLEIVYLGVAKAARGTGVADALLARIAAAARERSVRRVTLAVDHRNVPALRMYRRWGFAKDAELEAWIATIPGD